MVPHPVDIYVGKQLRVQRVIMGLSQEALAKAVGITFQQVQKYERGINRMSASRLYDFSRVLSVPISYFFDGFDVQAAQQGPDGEYKYPDARGVSEGAEEEFDYEQLFTRETLELTRCFHKIKKAPVKRRIVDLVRAIAEDKAVMNEEETEEAAA